MEASPDFLNVFNATKGGIILADFETGKITNVNPFLVNLLGYSKAELLKKHLWDIGIFENNTAFKKNLKVLRKKKNLFFEDLHLETRKKVKIDIEFFATVYKVGSKLVIQCDLHDITSHRLAVNNLLFSEQRYRRLFEAAKDGILILDYKTGMIDDVNPYLISLLGYSKKDFLQKYLWEVGVFKDTAASKENFHILQKKKYVRFEDLPLKTKKGEKVDVEFVANAYEAGDKTVIQCNIRNITERKKDEERIGFSESRYRRLFENAKDGILILDFNTGMILDVNPFLINLLGYSKKDFLKKHLWEVGVFKDVAASKENFEALQKKEIVRFEDLPLETKTGTKINVEFVANAYKGVIETVIQCNIRDITIRRRAENNLKISELRYRRLFETAKDGVLLLDYETGMIDDVNPYLITLLGYSKKDFLQKYLWEVGVFKDTAASKENFHILQKDKYVRFEDLPLKTKEGEKIDVEFVANAYDVGDKTVIQCNIRNITDRKRAENRLLEQKDRYEAMIESLGVGIFAVNKENKFVLINKAAELLIGLESSKLISDKKGPSDIVLEDESGNVIPKEKRPTLESLNSGKTFSSNKFFIVKKDKSKLPIDLIVTPLILDGLNIGAIDVFRDITEEKQIDKSKTELISLASHQLRTPLTALSWISEILSSGTDGILNPKQQAQVEQIHTASKRMTVLVNALLNVSRIELGTFTIQPETVNIESIVKDSVKELSPLLLANNLTFKERYDSNVTSMSVDPKLLSIIFENLLSNSIKYTPQGGHINLIVSKDEKDLQISVQDDGIGIPKNQQGKIFTKLFRGDNAQKADPDGVGLGLYIVKQILDKAGGKVWFKSEVGKGTTFNVSIPLTGMIKKEGTKQLS